MCSVEHSSGSHMYSSIVSYWRVSAVTSGAVSVKRAGEGKY